VNPNVPNPNVSAISLRSGKVVELVPEKIPKIREVTSEPQPEPEIVIQPKKEYMPPIPFPHRVLKSNKVDEEDKGREILDVFRKVAVNIPLLYVIKQVPKYAKFLKDKRKLKGNSRVNMRRNVSAIIQQTWLPEKCEDPGVFTVPCTIGDNEFENCMLDLGSSINVMPTSIYNSLFLGPLQPTCLVIQLANRSITRPKGIVEDVLVKVNDLIFPAYFYILDMQRETDSSKATLILGRPFMRTTR
jgi:hypothetical protein